MVQENRLPSTTRAWAGITQRCNGDETLVTVIPRQIDMGLASAPEALQMHEQLLVHALGEAGRASVPLRMMVSRAPSGYSNTRSTTEIAGWTEGT